MGLIRLQPRHNVRVEYLFDSPLKLYQHTEKRSFRPLLWPFFYCSALHMHPNRMQQP